MVAPGWATKGTAPLASKQTMHPCESPLLFVFWNLPCFSFLVSNYFDWFKQPFCFTLHAHLLLWHMYYTYIASLCGGFYGCLCTELFSVIFITPIAWAKFYLTKPRLQNNLVWCGQGLTISLPSTGSTVSNHFFFCFFPPFGNHMVFGKKETEPWSTLKFQWRIHRDSRCFTPTLISH